jgi:hypothetical protein
VRLPIALDLDGAQLVVGPAVGPADGCRHRKSRQIS